MNLVKFNITKLYLNFNINSIQYNCGNKKRRMINNDKRIIKFSKGNK